MTPRGVAVLVITAVGMALIYAGSCVWYPFAKCLCCKGKGTHQRDDSKVFRDCRWCRGSGRRLRIGRKIYNYFHQVKKRAKA